MTATLPIIRPRHRRAAGAADCGTPAGYQRHRRHGEDACDPCKASLSDRRGLERAEYDTHLGDLMVGRADLSDMTVFGATHFAGQVMGA